MTVTEFSTLASELSSSAATIPAAEIERARECFLERGYAKVPFIAPPPVVSAVGDEARSLVLEAGVRRDLRFAQTGNTARRMRNVQRAEVAERGHFIRDLYEAPEIHAVMAAVAGEEVLVCPYQPEQYVITCLEREGDTHGWHWDDYAFALVWVVEVPEIEHGGFVQCVPRTSWDKENPQVNVAMTQSPTYSIALAPGDVYMMRTDTTMHRVYPLQRGRRIIVNMGYAARQDLSKEVSHETMDALWE